MNLEEELGEFREFVKSLTTCETTFEVTTLEDQKVRGELNSTGLHILDSSVPVPRSHFDDFRQMIDFISPLFRQKFVEKLINSLSSNI